jgi:protein SCO1/2
MDTTASCARARRAVALVLAGLTVLAATTARAEEADAAYARHHRTAMPGAARSTADYPVPQVELVRADGKAVRLADEIDDGRAVVLDFVYTTCTSVCPLSSQVFESLQDQLGVERERVHLVSISIDPEQDTPERLLEYARHFEAGPRWQFYTGTVNASLAVQRAFRAYLGDKMSHPPVTLVRAGPGRPWTRFDGFATVAQILDELRQPLAAR